jgi:hypothetical protein
VKGEKWRANHGKLEWVGASNLAGSWPIAMHRQASLTLVHGGPMSRSTLWRSCKANVELPKDPYGRDE